MSDDVALDGELLPPARHTRVRLSDAEMAEIGRRALVEHEAGERSLKDAVKHFRRCGEILNKAKADLGHGWFAYFLKSVAKIHPRSAQRYMLLARSMAVMPSTEATRVSQLSLRDAIGELSRSSSRAAKLPPPALTKALAQGRQEPLKKALTRAGNDQRFDTFPTGIIVHSDTPMLATPAAPPPARPAPTYIASLAEQLGRTIRVYVETYPEMTASEALEAINAVYCDIQDRGLGGHVQ